MNDEQLSAAWKTLAAKGLLVELSSAAVYLGLEAIDDSGELDQDSVVVMTLTAGPYAQPTLPYTVTHRPSVFLAEPTNASDILKSI